jgi:hypothetical protein
MVQWNLGISRPRKAPKRRGRTHKVGKRGGFVLPDVIFINIISFSERDGLYGYEGERQRMTKLPRVNLCVWWWWKGQGGKRGEWLGGSL